MMKLQRIACAAIATVVLTGCGFWGGSEEVEPNKLVDFAAEKQVSVLWSSDIGSGHEGKFHQMSPAISGDNVYAASADGQVAAFTLAGSKLWSVDLDVQLLAGAGAGDNKVVVTTESGEVICLSGSDGSVLWKKQIGAEVVSEPQLNTQLVVVQTVSGKLIALKSATGEQAWVYDTAMPRLSLRGTSTPLVAMDVTLAGMDNGKFVALDNESGAVLWETAASVPEGRSELERMTDIDGRPLLFENVIFIPGFQGQLVAINPFTAQTLWSKRISSYRSLAAGFGNIYVSEANDHVQALDARSAASVWKQDQLENRLLTSPAAVGNYVAVGDHEGYLHFLSQIDGRFIARYDVGDSLTSDIKVKDNVLYLMTDDARLVALTLR